MTEFIRMKKRFTLAELLVVTVVILILAATLMPAMNQVRYRAIVAACKSNLRQIVLSATTYAGDNDWRYPKNGAVRTSNDTSAYYSLANCDKGPDHWNLVTPWEPYYQNYDIFVCPFIPDRGQTEMKSRNQKGAARFNDVKSSYAIFINTIGSGSGGTTDNSGKIAAGGSSVPQYDVNGNYLWDKTYKESQVMSRTTNGWTWTYGNSRFGGDEKGKSYSLFAMDKLYPGWPSGGLNANHPFFGYDWTDSVYNWQSYETIDGQAVYTESDANYADKDGSVRYFKYGRSVYYHEPISLEVPLDKLDGTAWIPKVYRSN